ncbi:MAG: bifunctional riboflavin kinase/FAD synthetase [Clostridiales bacterium]|nr:bifunctional riboflavin kinase/FAD synthetase [Clostridiales bacterium]
MQQTHKNTTLTLGMFDGVHKGHAALLQRAAEIAHTQNATPIAFTFTNHPQELFNKPLQRLTNTAERRELIEKQGVHTDAIPFTNEIAAFTPKTFTQFLQERYPNLQSIVVGYNYTFGARAGGTAQMLQTLLAPRIKVEILPPVTHEGEPVSSSRIREALARADIAAATAMLGRYYNLSGTVQTGRQIGRSMGFPTANLHPEPTRALPRDGVYATLAVWGSEAYPAITNVGHNPTVGGQTRKVETHILEEIPDLYNRELTIFFCAYLRPEQKFPSKSALSAQLERDADNALRILEEP